MEKGVGHRAADRQLVHLAGHEFEQIELGRNFGAADQRDDGPLGVLERGAERLQLLLHVLAGRGGQEMRQRLDRGVRPVRRRERVIDISIAQVSTKLDLLKFMTGKVDKLAIGGAMANTFLFAKGQPVGRSLCEREMADTAREILTEADKRGCEIILPEDAVTAEELK